MNSFAQSASNVFRGALKAFLTFPASIGSALAFTVVTTIRIQLDWPQQEPFNFLFNCLHWAFALGAIFSLALIVAERSRINRPQAFLTANLFGVAAVVVTFLGLYLLSSTEITGVRYAVISSLAAARVGAIILVSVISFIILSGYPESQFSFASSFFMAHKAFFIALIYGAVIMAGASGVARAVQALIYHAMSGKVYMYIGALAGFLAFTIFVGYFPDFRKGEYDEHREVAQKQPRFIEILFVYIMIPIVLALTVVLLIWAGKTVFSGMQVSFVRLSVIAASYTIGGIWLHAMVTGHESGMAKLYRSIYPAASLVILVFEAWAVINQLNNSGLKPTEYIFIMLWIVAGAGAVMLLIQKSKAHKAIAILICALAVFSVLPTVGYQALPVAAQVSRLEKFVNGQHMLEDGKLIPAATEPEQAVRVAVTDAVVYLANAKDAKLPVWFDKDLQQSDVFKTKLGFEQTWAKSDVNEAVPGEYIGTYLYLPPEAIDISDYSWSVNPQSEHKKEQEYIAVDGGNGSYHIYWKIASVTGIPSLKILLNDRVILEQTMSDYITALSDKYPLGQTENNSATLEDMSLRIETPEVKVLLVFNNIQINVDTSNDVISYWLDLKNLYLEESQ